MHLSTLDLSLTSTGVVRADGTYGTIRLRTKGMRRLAELRRLVLEAVRGCDLVAIEGYSYGARGRAVVSLGELGGVVRLALWDAGIPYLEVPPTVVKKYATGKGNASKEAVLVEAVRRLGYPGSSTDEADALWLHAAVCDAAGNPAVAVPEKHREALATIDVGAAISRRAK